MKLVIAWLCVHKSNIIYLYMYIHTHKAKLFQGCCHVLTVLLINVHYFIWESSILHSSQNKFWEKKKERKKRSSEERNPSFIKLTNSPKWSETGCEVKWGTCFHLPVHWNVGSKMIKEKLDTVLSLHWLWMNKNLEGKTPSFCKLNFPARWWVRTLFT